jgi:HEAT repeat protein
MYSDARRTLERVWRDPQDATQVLVKACHVLPHLATADAVLPVLRSMALGSPAGNTGLVRAAATWGLGRLASAEKFELLQQLLQDGDADVREAARLALAVPLVKDRTQGRLVAQDVP